MKRSKLRPGTLARMAMLCGLTAWAGVSCGEQKISDSVQIDNGLVTAPAGVAFVIDDKAAFVIDAGGDFQPGMAAPDDSIHKIILKQKGATIQFDWGRVGDAAVARLRSDTAATVTFQLTQSWPGFSSVYRPAADGVTGEASLAKGEKITWRLVSSPVPIKSDGKTIVLAVDAKNPARWAAGVGTLPDIERVDEILDSAEKAYQARRSAATGAWGDFVGAICDNLNNTRIYSSDNHMLAFAGSRAWAHGPNSTPYFCWDSFFNGELGCLEDPKLARETIRAILSCRTAEGFVPNFGHWSFEGQTASIDRSQPPVGAMCVWKMEQRWPDKGFLEEVYPELVKWHEWWPAARDGNHDGLLEWGSTDKGWQGALWETGWDDTPHFDGAKMAGHTMDANAVDLNSLWSMDAEYLALIAGAIGKTEEAAKFRSEHDEMNQRINDKLWNEELGIYCSRLWDDKGKPGVFLTRLTPMNFYPLICGVPDRARANRVLKVMIDPKKFWGKWALPTVAYDDPFWKQQHYWRGKVWAPVNYLVFQGVKRYGTPQLQKEFAEKSVDIFMHNWMGKGVCGENYLSSTGEQSSDPHYTWGSLMCLIGIESIMDVNNEGVPSATSADGLFSQDIDLRNIPAGGVRYHVSLHDGKTTISVEK